MVTADAPALDALLAHRLAVAGRLVRTLADAELAEVGVAAPACGVLMRLAGEDGLTQAEIARRQRVEAPTMCRTVDRLVRDGLVERRPDPGDRRATRVHLTSEGRRAASTGMNTVVRTVGGVVGAQVGAVVLAAHHAAGTSVPTESGFVDAFWVGAAGALVAALAACFASPGRPRGDAVAASEPGRVATGRAGSAGT